MPCKFLGMLLTQNTPDHSTLSYLRGIVNVQKRHLLLAMAFDLGVMMRKLFKMGTPRSLQGRLVHTMMLWWRLTTRASYYFTPNRGELWHAA